MLGIAAKAWTRIGYLRRNKFILDRSSLERMYISFVRPLLEYANIVWDNCTIENKRIVENIQLEAARIVTGGTKLCSIQRLYDETKWETLQKLCQLYKMINGLTPAYLQQLIPERVQQLSRYSLRNLQNFSLPVSRTVTYSISFLPSTIRDWNSLSTHLKNTASIASFKKTLTLLSLLHQCIM